MTDDLLKEVQRTGVLPGLPNRHFIDGAWRPSARGLMMESFDPGRAAPHAEFSAGDADDAAIAVDAAKRAGEGVWRSILPRERGRILARTAELIRQQGERLAIAEVLDSGKTINEARGDVAGAARCFDYYAGAADKNEGRSFPLGEDYASFSINEPVGVTAHIVPWNYPLSTAARSIAPALAAGCTAVVKPAEQTPMTALMLAELLSKAGLPDGVCNVVTGTGTGVGAPLAANPAGQACHLHRFDGDRHERHVGGGTDDRIGHARAWRQVAQRRAGGLRSRPGAR